MKNDSCSTKLYSGNTKEPLITIVMATFNGGKYIKDQLDSIIHQSWTNWKLIIRDDGSSDDTLAILSSYRLLDTRIELLCDEKGNLGICMNFAELMQYSALCEYLMFSDQDDVWLSTKIEDTFKAMRASELLHGLSKPLLIHTDLCLVNDQLKQISRSAEKFIKLNPYTPNKLNRLLAQNFIYGCTIMINRELLKESLPMPREAENHDYWVSLIASAIGHITYIPKSYILYRQHSSNFSGGISGGTFFNRVRRMAFGWHSMNKIIDMRIMQVSVLYLRIENRLNTKDKFMLSDYLLCAKHGGIKAVFVAIKNGIFRQGFRRTLLFYICMLKKRNINYLHFD